MLATMPWELESKQLARRLAVRPVGSVRRTALFMPGRKALCVKAAIDSGLINRKTWCIFVERDPEVMAEARAAISTIKFSTTPYFHVGPLSTLSLTGLLGATKLDYAFVDLCAPLTTSRANWLRRELGDALADDAAVALTLNRTTRNCTFVSRCRGYFWQHRHEWNRAYNHVRTAEYAGSVDVGASPLTGDVHVAETTSQALECGMLPLFHDSSILAAATLQGLLPRFRGTLDTCLEYKTSPGSHGGRMGVIRMRGLKRDQLSRSRLPAMLADLVKYDRAGPMQR